MKNFKNKVAVITGAGSGIGRGIAEISAMHKMRLVLADLDEEGLKKTLALVKGKGVEAIARVTDVSNLDEVQNLASQTFETFKNCHLLFNNAGVFDMAPFLESTPKSFDILFSINVKGTFFVMQSVAKHMVENKTHGKIINVSSQAGRRGEALVSHYCATKAAIISYTQSAALALAKHSINVNGIAPGVIDTPMWDKVDSLFSKYEKRPLGDAKKEVGENVPLGRMGIPEDLEGTAVFLASNDSDYITAQNINVDGGNWMS